MLNILESLKSDFNDGIINIEDVRKELYYSGWFPYYPTEEQALEKLNIN